MPKKHQKNIILINQKRGVDWSIVFFALFLTCFGLLMIFESSNVAAFRDFGDKYHYVKDQLLWLGIGWLGFIFASIIDYHRYYKLAVPIILATIVALILVFMPGIGIKALGAHRWIGVRSFTLQPGEFAKLALVLYLSAWLSYKEKGRFIPFTLLVGLMSFLVILEPDLGTAIIILMVSVFIYFASGAALLEFAVLIPFGLIASLILAITSPYRLKRLTSFLNPNSDPLGASYHIRQILISLGSGGWFGLGLGSSRQKYEYLPEATTDSIFAIIGEEFGFLGAVLLILVFIFFLYRVLKITKEAPDRFGMLLGLGILSILGAQIIVNLGSMTAIFPLTGVPLPFISYGGSNLIVSLISCGILINISRQKIVKKDAR